MKVPQFIGEMLAKYFRLEVEGIDNIPRKGRVLITPNHSGFSGLDAILLGHEIFKRTHRVPRILTHQLWFFSNLTANPANKLGFIEANMKNGLTLLNKNNLVVLFPEGEQGNFKPTSQKYRLQEFKRGFVRMALLTKTPIVPCVILGAEEANINLRKLNFAKYLLGSVLPLPLNVVPFPSKWKIKFLEPIELPFSEDAVNDTDLVHDIAADIKDRMQEELAKELSHRKFVYVKNIY